MKKLWLNLVIFFGVFLLLATTLGTILIMAPGMELLGVMYIRSTSGAITKSYSVTDATNYKEIVIKSDNIPITIEFVQSYLLTANMKEEFNGFAKAGAEPTLDVSTTSSAINIKSNEYEAFLAYSRSDESGLIVKVPTYYTNKIVVESNKSPITFSGLKADLKDVTIKTNGTINLNTDMSVSNLELTMGNKDAVIGEDVDISGYIMINSGRGNVSVPKGFTGNIYFKSNSGDIKVASCGDLKVESKTGEVKGNNDIAPIILGEANITTNGNVTIGTILGKATINSKNGDVKIGEDGKTYDAQFLITTNSGDVTMLGRYLNEESKITTKSGDINIFGVTSLDLTTTYGDVIIETSTDSVITTKSGDVSILNPWGTHVITTNNGDVTLGDGTTKCNVESAIITTIGGDVKIYNAVGSEFNIKTTSGNIIFNQNETKIVKLNINSKRGDIEATKLNGASVIKTSGEVNLEISKMNGKVEVEGNNRKVNVLVHDTCYYDLNSNKNIMSAPELNSEVKSYNTVPVSGNHDENTLKITTKKGKIFVSKM